MIWSMIKSHPWMKNLFGSSWTKFRNLWRFCKKKIMHHITSCHKIFGTITMTIGSCMMDIMYWEINVLMIFTKRRLSKNNLSVRILAEKLKTTLSLPIMKQSRRMSTVLDIAWFSWWPKFIQNNFLKNKLKKFKNF